MILWANAGAHVCVYEGRRKTSGLSLLLSFHVQLPTHIILRQKLHLIVYQFVSLFLMRSVYTRSVEHLKKVGVRATMD